jgi:hypothetical protein
MRRQTAELAACGMVLAALIVAAVVINAAQKRSAAPDGAADRGGGTTLDPSHYIRRTAVVRDVLNHLAGDARAGLAHDEYERQLAEVTAAVAKWRESLTPEEKQKSSAELVEAVFAGLAAYASTTKPAGEPASRLKSVDADLRSLDQALSAGR